MGFNIEQYELGDVYSNGAEWSNATGYTKAELISKIRDAKDSIEKLTKEANSAQVKYDEANGRYCADKCGKIGRPKCHLECWSKERDKSNYLGILNGANLAIGTARANIPVWQNELDDLIEKEAIELANKNTTTGGGTGGGTTPNTGGGTGGGTNTTPKKSYTVLYASIGGAVLILVVVGLVVFRGKTNN